MVLQLIFILVTIRVSTVCGNLVVDPPEVAVKLDGNKIVGGFVINITDAPYQISLQYENEHICGGSIVNKLWIVTAAHCTEVMRGDITKGHVLVGATIIENENRTNGEVHQIRRIIDHDFYNNVTLDYDIALIQLKSPITFSHTRRPIILLSQFEDVSDGTLCFVSGWGDTMNPNQPSNILRATFVPFISKSKCTQYYEHDLTNRMVCGGYFEGGKDSCQGDSGGPMNCNGKLFGIVSWGYDCAAPGKPGVYTEVAALRLWINKITKRLIGPTTPSMYFESRQ